jgi:Domain of unknown function (DUF4160)
MHVHVTCQDGEAKFWLEPTVTLAQNYGLSEQQLGVVKNVVEVRADECRDAWKKHFPG